MVSINITRRIAGIPESELMTREVVDGLIASLQVANGRAKFMLDRDGWPWSFITASTPATQQLDRLDRVEFFLDGVRKVGFLPFHPIGKMAMSQGKVSQIWELTIMYLDLDLI